MSVHDLLTTELADLRIRRKENNKARRIRRHRHPGQRVMQERLIRLHKAAADSE